MRVSQLVHKTKAVNQSTGSTFQRHFIGKVPLIANDLVNYELRYNDCFILRRLLFYIVNGYSMTVIETT